MDKLDRLEKRKDRLDERMIDLFEKRMSLVKKAAKYKKRRDIKHNKSNATDIVTSIACNTQTIEYAEGLIKYIYEVSKKLEHKILKNKQKNQKYNKKY